LDDMIKHLADVNVAVVVAGGNDHVDACTESPSDSDSVISVGSIGKSHATQFKSAKFSNWGKCVSVYTDGEQLTSTWIPVNGNQDSFKSLGGTSMSSGVISGKVAAFLADKNIKTLTEAKSQFLNSIKPVSMIVQGKQETVKYVAATPVNTSDVKPNKPNEIFSIPKKGLPTVAPINKPNSGSGNSSGTGDESGNGELNNDPTPVKGVPKDKNQPSAPLSPLPAPSPSTETGSNNATSSIPKIIVPGLPGTLPLANISLPLPSINNNGGHSNITTTIPNGIGQGSWNATLPFNKHNSTTGGIPKKGCKHCTDGALKCVGKNFAKCDHGNWIKFSCAPGTECRDMGNDVILCDYSRMPLNKNDTQSSPVTPPKSGSSSSPVSPPKKIPKSSNSTTPFNNASQPVMNPPITKDTSQTWNPTVILNGKTDQNYWQNAPSSSSSDVPDKLGFKTVVSGTLFSPF